jgi:hypothetical protein
VAPKLQQMETTQNATRQRGRSWHRHVEAIASLVDETENAGANNTYSDQLWEAVRNRAILDRHLAWQTSATAVEARLLLLPEASHQRINTRSTPRCFH